MLLSKGVIYLKCIIKIMVFSVLFGLPPAVFAEKSSAHVLILGDSLSAAYQIPADAGWVTLFTEKASKTYQGIKITNASFGGATTASGVQRLPELIETFNPTLIVLELGGNDGLQGKPLSYIKDNLATMIKMATSSEIQVLLVGIKIPPNYGARYTLPFFNQYEELAKQYNLLYIPFMLEGIIGNSELMQSDGIHPTAEAQPLILENLWPYLVKGIES